MLATLRIETPATPRGRALVTGVQGELHQLGANMVADVLEADGWNVRFLGTLTPQRDVLSAIEEHEPAVLGVSTTMLFNPGFLYLQLLRPQAGPATHAFLTAWEDRDAFRSYMNSEAHGISHSREPQQIMARTEVRHEAFEVLLDSRRGG